MVPLDLKEMKNSYPFVVVMEIALFIMTLWAFFSIFFISPLGTSMKVFPKNKFLLLNLE